MDHRAALHYTAAFLCAATIPKHYLVGQNKIKPAAATISDSHVPTRYLITPTWFFCIAYLAMSCKLRVLCCTLSPNIRY